MAESAMSQKELINSLQSALQEFDGVKVEKLIQQGLDVSHVYLDPQKYHNALHELVLNYIALPGIKECQKVHIKFIDTLVVLTENHLNIHDGDIKQQTALHLAASSCGVSQILRALLARGARVNQPDNGHQTALHKAVLHGSPEDVRTLLDAGADPNHMDNMGHSPIHLAVKRRNNSEILRLLIQCGGNVDINNPGHNRQMRSSTPLHMAARIGRTENARCLLELKAQANAVDSAGQTPLHVAANHEITGKLCAELLKYRARVDVCDSISGDSALHKAVAANMVENVRILLQGGACPNSADNQGNTPMHKAARNCTDLEIWHLLVRCGGKLDTINVNKETPLTVAQEAKNSPVMLLYWPTQAEI